MPDDEFDSLITRVRGLFMAGREEEGTALFRSAVTESRQNPEPSWTSYSLYLFAPALLPQDGPDWEALCQAEFERLVPEVFEFEDFRANLEKACQALRDHQGSAKPIRFRYLERWMDPGELASALWLPQGFLRWVDLRISDPPSDFYLDVNVYAGGVVDTPREMLHHQDGFPPFH